MKIKDIASLIGAAHKIPNIPIPYGKAMVNGTKQMTSLINDNSIDLTGEEIDWRKIEEAFWTQVRGMSIK